MPTVLEMVEQHLKANGYDGLFSDGVCGCELGDLAPCDEFRNDCEAGYRVDGCHPDCGDGCDFHIRPDKPTPVPPPDGERGG